MDLSKITEQMSDALRMGMEKTDVSRIMEMKSTECCGRDDGEEFTDAACCVQADNTAAPKKVRGIVVRSGYITDSIQILYEEGDGTAYGNARGGGASRILFDKGDSLKGVQGCSNISFGGAGVLSDIRITTKKGKSYGPFGSARNGKTFCIEVPEGGEFAGFYGKERKSTGLTKLGLLYYGKGGK